MAATGLLNPNEYLYRYRLTGFEKSWQITHQPSGIRYTLAPGNYLLEIECSPILSSNSVFYKQIAVIIEPPWWQTWWFISLSLVLLITAVTYIVLRYNKRKYQEQIRALQLQSGIQNERERISKELHDNIGTQLSYISSNMDWMIDAPVSFTREEERSRLSAVNKTAKEMISDLRQTIWAIKKESVPLEELSDKLKSFIQSQLLLKPDMEIRIEEDIRNNIRFSPTDALNIYRICQEAIVNCIKHSEAFQLSFFIQSGANESFALIIEDNGKGFEPNREYKGHYGLENMRHRANDLGASFSIVSVEGKGTKIAIERHRTTI
jgi:signal transduction histidine kinase